MHSRLHAFLTQPLFSHSPGVSNKCAMCSFQLPKINRGPSPHFGTTLETRPTLCPLSFGKSFMKIRSAVPENGCLVFCGERKKTKKKQKRKKSLNIYAFKKIQESIFCAYKPFTRSYDCGLASRTAARVTWETLQIGAKTKVYSVYQERG